MPNTTKEQREQVALDLAARPEGVTTAQLGLAIGMSASACKQIIAGLLAARALHKLPERSKGGLYFASYQQAKAVLDARREAVRERHRRYTEARRGGPKPKQKALTVMPAKVKAVQTAEEFARLPAIETAKTVRIVAETRKPRFEVTEAPSVISAADCRPWAAAAASQIGA